jgi:hypothetical protein
MRRRFSLALGLVALVFGVAPRSTWAYPHFVAYGYTACSVCHYNPLGNGPLTDYGRALGANEFSAKPFWNLSASDEEIGARSGFFGRPGKSRFRPSIDARYISVISKLTTVPDITNFPMSADLNMVFNIRPNLFVSATAGYIPPRGTEQTLVTREHYIGYRPSKSWGIYAGLQDTAFGTRIPDHTAFSRMATGLAQNDQTHGLMVNIANAKSDLNFHAFMGNMLTDSTLRQKGGSIMYEWEPKSKWRLGMSALHSFSDLRKRTMFAIHSRSGYEGGAALITEVGIVRHDVDGAAYSGYALLQSFTTISRGFHYLMTFEYLNSSKRDVRSQHFQAGPTIIISPFPMFEFRLDLQAYRALKLADLGTSLDEMRVMGQVHVFF